MSEYVSFEFELSGDPLAQLLFNGTINADVSRCEDNAFIGAKK